MAYARFVLTQATADLATFYERVAVLVGRPVAGQVLLPVKVPSFTGLNGTTSRAGADSAVAVMDSAGPRCRVSDRSRAGCSRRAAQPA